MSASGERAVEVALGFVREHTPESSTRLCAVMCCGSGCVIALGILVFAFMNPGQPATVASLVGVTGALIGSGAVALCARTRKTSLTSSGGGGQ